MQFKAKMYYFINMTTQKCDKITYIIKKKKTAHTLLLFNSVKFYLHEKINFVT